MVDIPILYRYWKKNGCDSSNLQLGTGHKIHKIWGHDWAMAKSELFTACRPETFVVGKQLRTPEKNHSILEDLEDHWTIARWWWLWPSRLLFGPVVVKYCRSETQKTSAGTRTRPSLSPRIHGKMLKKADKMTQMTNYSLNYVWYPLVN